MRQAHIARGATSVLDAMNPILASTSNGIPLVHPSAPKNNGCCYFNSRLLKQISIFILIYDNARKMIMVAFDAFGGVARTLNYTLINTYT